MDRGDCYPAEVSATAQAIMKQLKFRYPYRLCWQSKVGPAKWLEPSTEECVKKLLRLHLDETRLILVPIAFNCDHIETLHELDIELMESLKNQVIWHPQGRNQVCKRGGSRIFSLTI